MKKLIHTWIAMFLVTCAQAQGVHGIVMGQSVAGKSETLPGAVIFWQGTRSGTIADDNGEYSIGLAPGSNHLIFTYVGYYSDTVEYTGQTTINVELIKSAVGKEIIILGEVGSTNISTRNPMNFQTLNEKELCKAACCNLSESFETNASIDAAFADAITGTRQIRMLGLDGKYTQMMFDNVPSVRGLASTYGLTYVPGPWIKSIYIAKGVGSVTSGYESITGQINVAMKNPENADQLHVNGFAGSGGRMELNLVYRPLFNKEKKSKAAVDSSASFLNLPEEKSTKRIKTSTLRPVFLVHAALSQLRTDHNKDGFLDNPLFQNVILRNEWHLKTNNGLGGQYTFNYLHMKNVSGQIDYDPLSEIKSKLWGVDITTDRYEFTGKTGYVFSEKPWKSFGSQVNISWHDQKGHYGYRQYLGQQVSAKINLLFATRIGSDKHKITSGISAIYDNYIEGITFKEIPPVPLSSLHLNRKEQAPGVFSEYTFTPNEKFTAVIGVREDYHNIYGFLFTPRIHSRYSINDNTSIKLVAGKGYRTANMLMDNVGILASNREIRIEGDDANGLFGLKMEEAWNSGIIFTHKFKLNHRDGTLSIDAYHTNFMHQVVLDLEQAEVARFYNLKGKSYSNSAQIEMQWSPIKRLDWRLAYRWLEVRTDYTSGLLDKPLVNRHRAFTNLAYETRANQKGAQWRFDATLQWISKKRIPQTEAAHHQTTSGTQYSQDYIQLNAQVTYVIKKNVEVYLGGENLTNFMVHDAIISSDNPTSSSFDGSLLWGPVFGRMSYVGFRWILP